MWNFLLMKVKENDFTFCPLSEVPKERLRNRTNSSVVANESEESKDIEQMLTVPAKTRSIVGDGNCFFRALSFAIFGDECHHFKIRSIIVNHLLKNEKNIFDLFKIRIPVCPQLCYEKGYVKKWCVGHRS